ncbi:MAG: hypothetical protein O2962_08745, partial [Cyanobacteria bacterium]|nr:hypothetical protein [Cyanobacteriota bacterium]
LYLGIADLERRADNSILNGSDEDIDAINFEIAKMTRTLEAMYAFNFEPLASDENNQVRTLLQNRIIESILGGTDVGSIYGDQDLYALVSRVAEIYGDDRLDNAAGFTGRSGEMYDTFGVLQEHGPADQLLPLSTDALYAILVYIENR